MRRHGKLLVKNFPDKSNGGKRRALELAMSYRDRLLDKFPPISRKEVCLIKRSNNTSGITGVCTYAKPYTLRDGTRKESWYWEASWPDRHGKKIYKNFSVNKYGEEMARSMAIRARLRGLEGVEGPFWCCERGVTETRNRPENAGDSRKQVRRVA